MRGREAWGTAVHEVTKSWILLATEQQHTSDKVDFTGDLSNLPVYVTKDEHPDLCF